jgi:hypothetical protein
MPAGRFSISCGLTSSILVSSHAVIPVDLVETRNKLHYMNKVYLSIVTFTILSLSAPGSYAQSPGGVSSNLSLWLKADNSATLSPTTGSLNSWTYSNNSNQFTATVGSQPTVAPSSFNFLPSIAFNGSQMMLGPTGPGATGAPIPAGSLAYSIFAVWSSPAVVANGAPNMRVWAQRANAGTTTDNNFDGASLFVFPSGQFNGAPFFVTPSPYGDEPEISPYVTGVSAAPAYNAAILTYTPNTPYISELNLLNQNTNDLELMDQTNYATGPGVTSTDPAGNATVDRVLTDAGNFLGARSAALDEPLTGNLAELIVYSSNVSAAQRSQIFSYLSLKYGVPLGGTYYSSAGTTIWDAVAASSYGLGSLNYNHSVFGIGQDNASGLLVTQSNSATTGTGNGAGQSGMGNITISSPFSLVDQTFLIVGSNNAGLTETTTNLPPAATAGSERLMTQWLVTTTGDPGTVSVGFDFTGLTVTGDVAGQVLGDFRLAVDVDGDGDFTTGFIHLYQPTSFSGNVANFTNVQLSENSNEVMAIISNAGAGTPLPVNFVNVAALPNGGDVDVSWTVGQNQQAKDYQVQESPDGVKFTAIGDVANELNQTSYSFVQSNAGAGMHYYRILETDNDGFQVYSKIVSANLSSSEFSIRTLNNPVTSSSMNAEIELNAVSGGSASLEIWTLGGTRVATMMQTVASGTTRISLPLTNVASGTYAVKIRVNDVTHVVQIVKL